MLLEVEQLVKAYGSGANAVLAVAGVDVHVARGEVLGLVGESGSGKTSLAKCIVGLIDPTDGTIEFEHMDVTKGRSRGREARRRLQMVFQNPDNALNPSHTVGSILRRSLQLLAGVRSKRQQDAELEALTRSVRLEPRHLDVRPSALSGGLKQRVAIARSFAGKPSMVLGDEPTSALDVSVQAAILNLLVDLQRREGVPTSSSPDLAVVRYAGRTPSCASGRSWTWGQRGGVQRAPQHPRNKALFGHPHLDIEAKARTAVAPAPAIRPAAAAPTRCPLPGRYLQDRGAALAGQHRRPELPMPHRARRQRLRPGVADGIDRPATRLPEAPARG